MADASPPNPPRSTPRPPPRDPVVRAPQPPVGSGGPNVSLPHFQRVMTGVAAAGIETLADVELDVRIELGRSNLPISEVLRLAEGSVVELDKLIGEPVDVYANDQLVARGEVLVVDDNFCVRVSEIVGDVGDGD